MRERVFLIVMLVVMGASWGFSLPTAKMAVSTGYQHFGLVFWQMVIGAVVLGAILMLRGKGLPMGRAQVRFYVLIALIGTIFPNSASYQALEVLPSGVISVLLSLIPMLAFPVALLWGLDRFSLPRLAGLAFGLVGVLLLVLPKASLPDPAMIWFIPLAMVAPLFYAMEGNVIARWGTYGLDPIQSLCGASLIGAVLILPVVLATGQWIDLRGPYTIADFGLVSSALAHIAAYVGYFWLVGRAGPVFAIQVSYLATGFGMIWAMVLLSESYSGYVWAALAVMFVGLFLVQPRSAADLES